MRKAFHLVALSYKSNSNGKWLRKLCGLDCCACIEKHRKADWKRRAAVVCSFGRSRIPFTICTVLPWCPSTKGKKCCDVGSSAVLWNMRVTPALTICACQRILHHCLQSCKGFIPQMREQADKT